MLAVPSTLQLLLAIVLVLFGVCGNLVIPFVSYRTSLRCPHITVLAALDFTATLLGPGLMLVTIVTGPTWLEHNKTLCQSLSFLSSWVQITCFLVLFFLAVFCQKMQREVHPGETRHAKRRELVFLALCLLAGLLLSVLPLLGWSSYNGLHLLSHTQIFSNHSILYLMCSFVVLSITTFLAIRAMKLRRLYPAELFWERHKYELRINDPEMTTRASVTSSNQSRATVRSNRSLWSRRSSGRSGILSFVSTPMASRKTSQQSRAQDNVLLEVVFRQAQLNAIKRFSFSANGTNEDTGKETSEMRLSVPSLDTEWKTRSVSNPRDPSVISSRIPHNFPIFRVGKKVFQSPRLLPQFKALQQQRSLSRLLLMKSCVTALCWLPLISIVVLQLSSVHYPLELHVFIQWLIFIPSSISPLFALCDARYRQVLRRAACAVVKTCACGTKTQTAKTRDVEFKIEGTQQVRLTNVKIS